MERGARVSAVESATHQPVGPGAGTMVRVGSGVGHILKGLDQIPSSAAGPVPDLSESAFGSKSQGRCHMRGTTELDTPVTHFSL